MRPSSWASQLAILEPVREVGRQYLREPGGERGRAKAAKIAALPEIGLL
jgi:hypothetical protein